MKADQYKDLVENSLPNYPLGRIGEPDDVANLIAYLVSDEASWITGTAIHVDGGRLVSPGPQARAMAQGDDNG